MSSASSELSSTSKACSGCLTDDGFSGLLIEHTQWRLLWRIRIGVFTFFNLVPATSLGIGGSGLRDAVYHRKLVDDQPVEADVFDGVPKLLEVHRLLNVTVGSQPIAIDQVAFLFGGCQDDDRDSLGARVGLEP